MTDKAPARLWFAIYDKATLAIVSTGKCSGRKDKFAPGSGQAMALSETPVNPAIHKISSDGSIIDKPKAPKPKVKKKPEYVEIYLPDGAKPAGFVSGMMVEGKFRVARSTTEETAHFYHPDQQIEPVTIPPIPRP